MTTMASTVITSEPAQLYLELLKRTLAFLLWPEPSCPIEMFSEGRSVFGRGVISVISRLLATRGLGLVRKTRVTLEERVDGAYWPGCADTMIGLKRLDNIQHCVESVLRENIPGDLIETGVWRGGACIFMRGILAAHGVRDRTVYVADSFRGLPRPDVARFPVDEGDQHHTLHFLSVSRADVENNFRRYGLLDTQVVFLEGWFRDTLSTLSERTFAVIRLDGDMYGSTMDALAALYPRLSSGGFCIIDDYALKGCRMAVDDYRRSGGITSPMSEIDWTGRVWRKE